MTDSTSARAEVAGVAPSILLVDDEAAVRRALRRILETAGYTVTEAQNGVEGVHRLEQQGEFDLVISDIVMPEMDGVEFERRARERHPEMRWVFVTGYAPRAVRDLPEDANLLMKPFDRETLLDKVATVLQTPPRGTRLPW